MNNLNKDMNCYINNCTGVVNAKGLCKKHYIRLSKHGTTELPTIKDRLENNYIPVTESGCWLWTGSLTSENGYGRMMVNNKTFSAHRLSYETYLTDYLPAIHAMYHHALTL